MSYYTRRLIKNITLETTTLTTTTLSVLNPINNTDIGSKTSGFSYEIAEFLTALLAIIGNGLVIAIFFRDSSLRKSINYQIISLAIADFIFGLIGIPCAILISFTLPKKLFGCLTAISILFSIATVSIFCRVGISINRYWAIIHPISYAKNHNEKVAIYMIGACWILGIIVGFLPLLGWYEDTLENKCIFIKKITGTYLLFYCIVTAIIPAVLFIIIYGIIFRVIHQRTQKAKSSELSKNSVIRKNVDATFDMEELENLEEKRLENLKKREIKATKNMAIIVVISVVLWMPLNIISFQCSSFSCDINTHLKYFAIFMTHIDAAINPFIYAYHLKDFRIAWRRILRRQQTDS